MQPILVLAVVGVAAAALGTGFLNNDIELWVQQFGVGDEFITSPTDHAQVDFNIAQRNNGDGTFDNIIDLCYVTPDDLIGTPDVEIKDSEIWCKLTNINGDIIAEGVTTDDFFPAFQAVEVDTEPDVLIQDVHDVIVVIHADTYSMTDANGNTVVMPAPSNPGTP